jgi:hypothetical protein
MATSENLELPPYNPARYIPSPSNVFPSLSINSRGTAYLSRELTATLGLRDKQLAALVPPPPGEEYWHLDLTFLEDARPICWYADTRPRIRGIKLPIGLLQPGQPLRLCLVPGDPKVPGFYRLLPDAYFTPKQTPPLAA